MSNGNQQSVVVPNNPDGTCPDGSVQDPTSGLCFTVPPIKTQGLGVTLPDVDPKNAAELAGLGTGDSQLPERWALAHWHTLRRIAKPPVDPNFVQPPKGGGWWHDNIVYAIQEVVNLYDWAVSLGVTFMGDSATRNNPGFWKLVEGLISDLLGVSMQPGQLYQQLQTHGTVAAMRDVGASLVNLLIGEFTGTASGSGGNVSFSTNVNPDTQLPVATLTPAGGVKAAQALMGFVLSSAVRQGNLEAIGSELGWLGGHVEKFSEAMRTNLGIGRMLRFALRPIFQDLVATPMKWAMNLQYRTSLFNVAEAAKAFLQGDYQHTDYMAEAALAGYSDKRALSLLAQHTRKPDLNHLFVLRAQGLLTGSTFDTWLGNLGYGDVEKPLVTQASDFEPVRRVALALAEHYMLEFGKGQITAQALKDFINGLRAAGFYLTPGELSNMDALTDAVIANTKLRIRHLSPGQIKQAFIDGTITLDEYEQHLRDLGYVEADVQTLGIEVLIALQKAQAAAAKHAAAAKKGAGPATSPTLAPSTGSTPAIP